MFIELAFPLLLSVSFETKRGSFLPTSNIVDGSPGNTMTAAFGRAVDIINLFLKRVDHLLVMNLA